MTYTPATLAALAAQYDAFLVDQFGVLLDGTGAYHDAPAHLSRLAATGKPIVLLSNSGKRSAANEARLTQLGFRRGDYLTVLSSGEAAHSLLTRRLGTEFAPQSRVWLHGRDSDTSAVDGLGLRLVDAPDDADLIVLAGSRGDTLSLDAYRERLGPAAQRQVPMLCTNPDLEMLTAKGTRFGAGAIANAYHAMGGPVEWIGKPHPLIYAEAAHLLPGIAPQRILCIGDSPAHDIAGGQAAGHATALVHGGLHADLDSAALMALCASENVKPDHVLARF